MEGGYFVMISEEDERVVSLSFDNKNFEKHAKESMSTLDKLKEKLMFKNVKEDSASTLKGILNEVETIASKSYSIIDRTVDKIKDNISNKIVSTLRSITIEPITSGWSKFGDKTRSVGTLISQGYNIETVTEQLEKLNSFTDETSYNFVDMVGNIAKFTAAGQSLENSVTAMQGIANWAALSGQNAQVASSAMYQLSQALSAGAMRKEDWKSIQNYSMDTREFRKNALEAGVAIGTLKKNVDGTYQALTGKKQKITMDNFVDTLTENAWFTKDVMLEVYKTYGGAFDRLNELVDENNDEMNTLTKVIKYTKKNNEELREEFSELSGLQEEALEDELVRLSEIKEITDADIDSFQKLYNIDSREEAAERLERYTGYVSEFSIKALEAAQEARTLGDAIDSIKDATSTAFMNIYQSIFGDYERAKSLWTDLANNMYDMFQPLWNMMGAFSEWGNGENAAAVGGRDDLFRGIYALAAGVRDIKFGIDEALGMIFNMPLVDLLRKISLGVKEVGYEFYNIVYKLSNSDFFTDIGTTLNNIISPLKVVISTAISVFKTLFPKTRNMASLLQDLAKRFKKFSEIFVLSEDSVNNIARAIRGVLNAISLIKKAIMFLYSNVVFPVISKIFTVLSKVAPIVFKIAGTIGDIITQFTDYSNHVASATENMGFFSDMVEKARKIVQTFAVKIKNFFNPQMEKVGKQAEKAAQNVNSIFDGGETFNSTGIAGKLKAFKERFLELFGGFESFKDIFEKYKTGEGFFNFVQLVEDLLDNVVKRIGVTVDAFLGAVEILSENPIYQGVIGTFKDIWTGIKWLYTNLIRPVLILITASVKATAMDLYKALSAGDIVTVMDKINAILKSGILYRLWKTLSGVRAILGGNGILGLVKNTSKTLKSFRKYIDAKTMEVYAGMLTKFVVALAAIMGIILLISLIPDDQLSKVWNAFAVVAATIGAVTAAAIGIGIAMRIAGTAIAGLALVVLGMASTFLIMFIAIKSVMNQIKNDKEAFKEALEIVEDLFNMIAATIETISLTNVLSKFKGKENPAAESLKSVGVVMLGIAAALLSFSIVAEKFKDVDGGAILKTMAALGIIAVAMGIATKAILSGLKGTESAKSGVAAALAVLGLAATMALIVVPLLESIANDTSINWDNMFKSIGYISLALLAITGSFWLMNVAAKNSLSNLTAMIAFWGLCKILRDQVIPMMKDLSEAEWDVPTNKLLALGGAALGISAVILSIGGAIALATKNTSQISAGKIILIGAAIVGFAYIMGKVVMPALTNLKKDDWIGIAQYVTTVITTFGAIIALLATVNAIMKNKTSDQTKNTALILVSLATVIMTIGHFLIPSIKEIRDAKWYDLIWQAILIMAPLALLIFGIKSIATNSMTQFKTVTALVAGIGGILLVIGTVLLPSLKGFDNTNYGSMITAAIITIGSIVALFAGIYQITKLGMADFGIITSLVSGMAAVLLSMSLVIVTMSKLNPSAWGTVLVSGAAIIGVILSLLLGIKGILVFGHLQMANVISLMAGISGVMLSISAAVLSMSSLTNQNAGSICVAALGILAILGTLLVGLYELTKLGTSNLSNVLSVTSGISVIFVSIGLSLIPAMATIKNENAGAIAASVIPIIGTIISVLALLPKFIGDKQATWQKIGVTLIGLATIFSAIGGLVIPALSKIRDKNTKAIFVTALSVAAMLSAVMYAFYQYNKNFKYVDGKMAGMNWFNSLVNIVSMVAIIVTVGKVLPDVIKAFNELATVPWENILFAGVAISGIVLALGYAGKIAGGIKFLAIAGGIALIAFALAGLFSVLADFNWSRAGVKIVDEINDGLTSEAKINSPSKLFAKDGKYIVQGLEKGMSAETKKLSKYGINMADTIDTAFCKLLKIQSPSKVMYENGRFVVVGLANGMSSYESKKMLSDSSKTIGSTIGDSIGSAVSDSVTSSISDGFKGLFGKDGIAGAVKEFLGEDENGNINWGSLGEKVGGGIVGSISGYLTGEDGKKSLKNVAANIKQGIADSLGIDSSETNIVSAIWHAVADGKDKNSIIGRIDSLFNGDTTVEGALNDLGTRAMTSFSNAINNDQVKSNLKTLGETVGSSIVTGISDTLWEWSKKIPFLGDLFQGLENYISAPDTEFSSALGKYYNTVIDEKNKIFGLSMQTDKGDTVVFEDAAIKNALAKLKAPTKQELEKYNYLLENPDFGDAATYLETVTEGSEKKIQKLKEVLSKAINDGALYKDYNTGLYRWAADDLENVQEWKKEIKKILGIESPSKFIRDDIVGNIMKGFPSGIKKYESTATKAVNNAMNTLKSDISSNFNGIDLLADPNYKVKTTLVPMIDTSGIQNGVSSLSSTLTRTTDVTNQLNQALNTPIEQPDIASTIADTLNNRVNDIIAAVYASATQNDVNVTVTANKDKIFDAVIEKTRQYKSQTGRSYQF